MNLDIEQIRGAVRVARPVPAISRPFPLSGYTLNQIEALCDEIERLRALYVESEGVKGWDYANVVAERDAALAECELLNQHVRLRNEQEFHLTADLQAWRGCADQLVHCDRCKKRCCREALAMYERLTDTP